MNGSHGNNNNSNPNNNIGYIVRLRGLPLNFSQSEIQNFLQGCKIRQINFSNSEPGRTSSECFVQCESKEDFDLAKTFDQKIFMNRPIDVIESSVDEMNQKIKSPNSNESQSNNNVDNWPDPVIRLRGLPYNAGKEEVTIFFKGLAIAPSGIHISTSKPAGEAYVAFVDMENATKALEFDRKNMGHRYIEVLKSTYTEARASIMNDTQNIARQQRGAASGNNSQRQGTYSGQHHNVSSGYENYNGPSSNNFNSFSGHNNNYPINNNPNGVKHSMSMSFTMKIRGVPFEAGEKEVFEFFSPVVPIRLEQENTPRGKPPIWYAEFGSREEATEALTFHNKYIGNRYIELLPLYDDGNRTKMGRTY